MATQIKLRRDTAANWSSANPVLAQGEPGYDLTSKKLKIGDGVTSWNSLAYFDDKETDFGQFKIDDNILGTIDNPNTGGWGGYDMLITPGGSGSDALVYIPSVGNQAAGLPVQIHSGSTPTSLVQLFGRGGVQVATNVGANEQIFEFAPNGTLFTPTIFPKTFTATVDAAHYAGEGSLTLTGDAWHFEVSFIVGVNGGVETQITNNTPWVSNPGYANDMPFEFAESDHGIPGYTFTLTLIDIQNPGPAGWTTNLAASIPPSLPATIQANDIVKLTADATSWTFDPYGILRTPGAIFNEGDYRFVRNGVEKGVVNYHDGDFGVVIGSNLEGITKAWLFGDNGNLRLPEGGDIVDSTGTSVLGGAAFTGDLGTNTLTQSNSYTRTVSSNAVELATPTIVWTSLDSWISSAKLVIQVETNETGDVTGWHTQSCEAIIAARANQGDPAMTVYAVTHTSVDSLMTFTVGRNVTSNLIEVTATPTAAMSTTAYIRIHSVEMMSRD